MGFVTDLPSTQSLDPLVLPPDWRNNLPTAQKLDAAADTRALELSYLTTAISPDLLDIAHLEVPSTANLQTFSDSKGGFLGLRNYLGQPFKNGGVRAEATVDYPFVEGQSVRYTWRFSIGKDFQSDTPNNRWWLFADWHDQPDKTKGENWTGFPSHSPSAGFGYGVINGQDYLAMIYGAPTPRTVALIPFDRNVWHTIRVDITWSRGTSGRALVYFDNSATPVHVATGPNMYNNYQHFLKLGSYREQNIPGDVWVFIRDVKIDPLG